MHGTILSADTREQVSNLTGVTYDGRETIIAARQEGLNYWRQMEWAGFHIEHLCRERPGAAAPTHSYSYTDRVGNTTFDSSLTEDIGMLRLGMPIEVKLSLARTQRSAYPKTVILNDAQAMDAAITQGGLLVLMFQGFAVLDTDYSFADWRTEYQGGLSAESLKNRMEGRSRRKRKKSVTVQRCAVMLLNSDNAVMLQKHEQGRNSGAGAPRAVKYKIQPSEFMKRYPDSVDLIQGVHESKEEPLSKRLGVL